MKNKIITISLISLFSIILWGAISLNEEYFTTVKMPISFHSAVDSAGVSDISVEEVVINIKGQGWQLAKLSLSKDLTFMIRAKNRYGVQSIITKNELETNSWFSTNFQVTEILPEKISFFIEKSRSKFVKIIPKINLEFKDGFSQVDSISLSHDSVKISGPLSLLKNINYVNTKTYQFNNLDKKIRERLELEPIKMVKFNTTAIFATVDVQKVVDKVFDNISIETIDVPSSFSLQLIPAFISVKLRGGINVLGRMTAEELKATINFRTAFSDTLGYLKPDISIPNYTSIIETFPARIEYIIKQH